MAKRRTKLAKARAEKRTQKERSMGRPGGNSVYARKRKQQANGKYRRMSPFRVEVHEVPAGPFDDAA